MHLLVGLGNPGAQYERNRHNIGFLAVDEIARRHNFGPFRQKFNGLISEGNIDGEKVLLLKPQTFMNRSGDSIVQATNFYKIAPQDVTVLYDELDLVPGKLRVKVGGGSGGHNGIRSIDPQIGPDYRRVRLGIGHPGSKDAVMHYVLGDFAKSDATWLDPLLEAVADSAGLLVRKDDNGFMNKVAIAGGKGGESGPHSEARKAEKAAPKGQSHIRAARPHQNQAKVPETGPMAAMLKKLFGKDEA
ncbi:aminoacyl-tRNA hydrolase [Paradevosia shaoguanensis]|uniref:aminoacyl-tRNA hydrolase n=1 Tax=Paradevosia shaoguanensis TaxID=1335043 RepID=UPI00193161FE|nr:aminoacyl-tRNA hydrolase [Paradevosia shaoguanensis]